MTNEDYYGIRNLSYKYYKLNPPKEVDGVLCPYKMKILYTPGDGTEALLKVIYLPDHDIRTINKVIRSFLDAEYVDSNVSIDYIYTAPEITSCIDSICMANYMPMGKWEEAKQIFKDISASFDKLSKL